MLSNYFAEHQGGIEAVARGLADSYRARGHAVRWMAAEAGPPHAGLADDVGFRAWNVTERRLGFPYPLPSPLLYGKIRREVAASDVLHLHDCLYAANIAAFVAARAVHKPVLLTQHVAAVPYENVVVAAAQRAAYATAGRALLTGADQVTFVSPRVMAHFSGRVRFRRPPEVVENGVDTGLFRPPAEGEAALRARLGVPERGPTLLFVGRFVSRKGLEAVRAAVVARPDWFWVLIGREGDVDPRSWHAPNAVVLAPMAAERLRDYYGAADLLVLPSRGEGFPLAVQEAMTCGTPALVSEETRQALPEVAGHLFGAPPEPSLLAGAIAQALGAVLPARLQHRERVSAFAARRWDRGAAALRYEMLLGQLAGVTVESEGSATLG